MAVANAVNSQLYGFHWLRDSIDSQEQLAAILDKCLTDVFVGREIRVKVDSNDQLEIARLRLASDKISRYFREAMVPVLSVNALIRRQLLPKLLDLLADLQGLRPRRRGNHYLKPMAGGTASSGTGFGHGGYGSTNRNDAERLRMLKSTLCCSCFQQLNKILGAVLLVDGDPVAISHVRSSLMHQNITRAILVSFFSDITLFELAQGQSLYAQVLELLQHLTNHPATKSIVCGHQAVVQRNIDESLRETDDNGDDTASSVSYYSSSDEESELEDDEDDDVYFNPGVMEEEEGPEEEEDALRSDSSQSGNSGAVIHGLPCMLGYDLDNTTSAESGSSSVAYDSDGDDVDDEEDSLCKEFDDIDDFADEWIAKFRSRKFARKHPFSNRSKRGRVYPAPRRHPAAVTRQRRKVRRVAMAASMVGQDHPYGKTTTPSSSTSIVTERTLFHKIAASSSCTWRNVQAATARSLSSALQKVYTTISVFQENIKGVLKGLPDVQAMKEDIEQLLKRADIAIPSSKSSSPLSSLLSNGGNVCNTPLEAAVGDSHVRILDNFSALHKYSSQEAPSAALLQRLLSEIATMGGALPGDLTAGIFVRIDGEHLNRWRVLISGPEDTPYAYGLFAFDLYVPNSYPQRPPLCEIVTTGNGTVRFNPNLYQGGKVCLSLLGTWYGSQEESWRPGVSTLLQVLVSIQSLIMVPDPYFNEPGYQRSRGTPEGTAYSDQYNANLYEQTLRWAIINQLRNPMEGCETVIRKFFLLHAKNIAKQVALWKTMPKMTDCKRATLNQLLLEFTQLLL